MRQVVSYYYRDVCHLKSKNYTINVIFLLSHYLIVAILVQIRFLYVVFSLMTTGFLKDSLGGPARTTGERVVWWGAREGWSHPSRITARKTSSV